MKLALAGGNALRRAAAPVTALVLLPAAMVATGPAGAGPVIAALADPIAVLTGRSPGARPAGALTQSKHRRVAANGPRHERVLPLVRYPAAPAESIQPADYVPGDVLPFGDIAPDVAFPAEAIAFSAPGGGVGSYLGGGGIGGAVGGGGIGGVGSGGGGDTTTPVTGTTPPPTETAAVPEPATWLSLLLGLFGVGALMRRRQPSLAHPALR